MRPYQPLADKSRVALVAPSGPLKDGDLDRAVANCRRMGWEPFFGDYAEAQEGYFAGPDELRLADFNNALHDDDIAGIWCLRGGYGAMRLLDGIDFHALERRPKPIIGFSDITALHAAIGVHADLCGIHGPTARGKLTEFSEKSLRAAVTRTGQPAGDAPNARTLQKGKARGHLMGGNLSLLTAILGTKYQPDFKETILVLEDVNEAPYRIERMLLQLRLAGLLQQCAGIAFGHFTSPAEDKSLGGERTIDAVLAEAAGWAGGIPVIAGIPLGHIEEQWSLPLGAGAELDADAKRLTVLPL